MMEAMMKDVDTAQKALDEADTKISIAIGAIADELRKRVKIRLEIDTKSGFLGVLIWGKWNSKWQFLVDISGRGPVELLSAPRDIRAGIMSGRWIRKLLELAAELLSDELAQRSSAIAEARELMADLGITREPS